MSAVFMELEYGRPIVWIPSDRSPLFQVCDLEKRLNATIYVGRFPAAIRKLIDRGATFVAHNAEAFDAQAWARLCPELPQPTWYDTIHCCRAAGLPAGLDAASRALGGSGKDEDGSRAVKLLYTAKVRNGQVVYPVGTPALWEIMLRYNIQDVLELKRVYEATRDYGEADVLEVNSAINQRGIYVDMTLANQLRNCWNQYAAESKGQIAEWSEGGLAEEDISSPARVKAWLRECGIVVPSLDRKTVQQMIDDPDSYFGDTDDERVATFCNILRLRMDSTRATVGKLSRLFSVVDDDSRVRNALVYHTAHTGRWAGRDLQPHNFYRGIAALDNEALLSGPLTLEAVKVAAEKAKGSVGDALATLMRSVVCAPPGRELAIADYASIEARGVAWAAGDEQALEVFKQGRDPYCEIASVVYGRTITKEDKPERNLGKVIELACGYQMGRNKFAATARNSGIDLATVGVSSEQCVKAYRDKHKPIVEGWRTLHRAAEDIANGIRQKCLACRCVLYRCGSDMRLVLPSGRELVYRGIAVTMGSPPWNPGGQPIPQVTYVSSHGYRKHLYGGLLMENLVQALCRDLLAGALIRTSIAYKTVLHVHDEIVCEVKQQYAADCLRLLCQRMSEPPAWAAGFPIKVEGFTCPRYVKAAWSNSYECVAQNGEITKWQTSEVE